MDWAPGIIPMLRRGKRDFNLRDRGMESPAHDDFPNARGSLNDSCEKASFFGSEKGPGNIQNRVILSEWRKADQGRKPAPSLSLRMIRSIIFSYQQS